MMVSIWVYLDWVGVWFWFGVEVKGRGRVALLFGLVLGLVL